jgi:hypothetical protein
MNNLKFILPLFLMLYSCSTLQYAKQDLVKNEIQIDTDNIIAKSFYGGGVQWEPNDYDSMSNEQWDRLLDRVSAMKLGYIRCIISSYTYFLGMHDGKPQFIWDENPIVNTGKSHLKRGKSVGVPKDKHNFTDQDWINLARRQWQDLIRILEFCQSNDIDVMFGDWAFPNDTKFYYISVDDPNYAYAIGQCVNFLIKEKGFTCIKEYNLGNEVNINPNHYTWKNWSQGVRNIYAEFTRLGINKDIKIVGPDGGYWKDLWFNNTITQLADEVKVIDYHWYINNDWLLTNRVEDEMRIMRFFTQQANPSIPNIFGEVGVRDGHNTSTDQHKGIKTFEYAVGMADIFIQSLRAGWTAVVAWAMDDAMHYHVTGDVKEWGFWNSIGDKNGDTEIRPWYYTWSLLSQYFPKGSSILYSNSFNNNGLNGIAIRTPDGHISYAIVNNRDFSQSVSVKIPNSKRKVDVAKFSFFENNKPTDKQGFPVHDIIYKNVDFETGLDLYFPSKGFILLTTSIGNIPEISTNTSQLIDPLEGLGRIHSHSKNLGMNGYSKHYDFVGDSGGPDFGFGKFKQDRSTIHPASNDEKAFIIYHFDGIRDFDIQVSGNGTVEGRFTIYGSTDGVEWKKIETEFSEPELTIWNWYHSNLKPSKDLNMVNYLKIELDPKGDFQSSRLRYITISK